MKQQFFNIIDRSMMGNDFNGSDDVIVEFCKILSFHGYPSKPELRKGRQGVIVKEIPQVVWQTALEHAHERTCLHPG